MTLLVHIFTFTYKLFFILHENPVSVNDLKGIFLSFWFIISIYITLKLHNTYIKKDL
jgi:hypothetical protein